MHDALGAVALQLDGLHADVRGVLAAAACALDRREVPNVRLGLGAVVVAPDADDAGVALCQVALGCVERHVEGTGRGEAESAQKNHGDLHVGGCFGFVES